MKTKNNNINLKSLEISPKIQVKKIEREEKEFFLPDNNIYSLHSKIKKSKSRRKIMKTSPNDYYYDEQNNIYF